MSNSAKIKQELEAAVRSVFDDDEFVIGMRSICRDDRDRLQLIEFIRKGSNVTTKTVAYKAMDLRDARRGIK